ncbi:MAG: hypothetical protein KGJ98_10935 [Chloroflexota bacterium]|nr:hypothetical protein [Chloroflexota bacterium]
MKVRERVLRSLAMVSVLSLVATACSTGGPAASGAPSGSAGAGAGSPTPGGRVVVGSISDAKVLNPVLSTDVPSADVDQMLYEPLLTVDPKNGQPAPDLAEKWTISPDSKTYTFTLRPGLVWSDGSPFTGEDFKFTAEAVMRSKTSVRKNIFQDIVGATDFGSGKATDISGIQVSGDTITVQFTKAFCPALTDVGGFGIIPKSVFGKYIVPDDPSKNLDNAPENTKPPVSDGPFMFKEWVPNDHITLVANPHYFKGKPLLDEWDYKIVSDSTALAASLKTGEIDVGTVDPEQRDDLKKAGTLDFFDVPGRGYTYIGWNELRGGKEFFQDKTVRQALAYGLNIQEVVQKVLLGEGTKMIAHEPPVSWAYSESGLNPYNYDPKKAQSLLEGDGWKKGSDGVYQKNGQKLAFTLYTNSGNKVRDTFQQVAVEQYKQIGVDVTAKTESFEALVDRLTKSKDPKYGAQGGHDYDAVIIGWSLGTDPDAYSIWDSTQIKGGFDFVGYNDPTVDKALTDGRTMCQLDQRKTAYQTFDKQLNEDQPYNFGFDPNELIFVNKKFQGVAPGPFGGNVGPGLAMWNIEKWWIKK